MGSRQAARRTRCASSTDGSHGTAFRIARTSHRASLGITTASNFTSHTDTPHMVWKGVGDDPGIYHSELLAGGWSPQERISGAGCSHSPALTQIQLAESVTPGTGLFMAWKGAGRDPGIYWARHDGHEGWSPQRRVPNVGTSDAPALVAFQGRLLLFWKGAGDDHTAYFSSFDPMRDVDWLPQKRVEYDKHENGRFVRDAIGTTAGPAATVRGDSIMLCWKGATGDSGIWTSLFADGEFSGQMRIAGVGTSVGPSVAQADGRTYVAWKGIEGDSTIYWTRL